MQMQTHLDSAIDRALSERRLVGTVVLVARDGEIVYRRAAGFADREKRKPMAATQVFRLSSLTKPIMSTAALVLVEKGQLRLEDPVTRWLTYFRPKLPDGREPPITIRQLLTHTAGLGYGLAEEPNDPYRRANIDSGLDDTGITLEETLRKIAAIPLFYEPGTSWRYSLAIDVLGAVLERVGNAPLGDVVRRLVTGPLQMTDTDFFAREPDRLAVPYVDGQPEPVLMTDPHEVAFGPPGGIIRYAPSRALNPHAYPSGGVGMVGTADDFLRLLETLRKGGAPILTPATVQTMMTNQIGNWPVVMGPGWGFGYGGALLTDPAAANTPQSAGTFEWGGVYGHLWFIDPQRRLSVVSLTNTALEGMIGPFTQHVRDALYL